VGAVGYLMGGGHGWLASRTGLAANDLLAVEVVTADGELLRIDDEADDEAMWALRGGGCGWAAVTAAEVRLHPVGEIAGGSLMFGVERAGEVLEAWRPWSAGLPEGVTTIGRVLRFPPVEPVPEPLRGHAFAIVEVVDLDGPERLDGLLADLRALEPAMDMVRPMRSTDLPQVHMDPPEPVPAVGGGLLVGELSADALGAIVAAGVEGPGEALIGTEVRRLGGPVARARAEGVVCAVGAEGALYAVGIAAGPDLAAASKAGIDAVRSAAAPHAAGHGLPNLAAESGPAASIFTPDDLARLTAVADRMDPGGRFVRRP
jgi:FAD/FMN-containing dehydrogenase